MARVAWHRARAVLGALWLVLQTSHARAQAAAPPPPRRPNLLYGSWRLHLGLPLSLGYGTSRYQTGNAVGFWFAQRAQALLDYERGGVAPFGTRRPSSKGVGVYGEWSVHPTLDRKRPAWGAGLSWLQRSNRDGQSESAIFMPSVGWYRQDHGATSEHGVQLGLSFGWLGNTTPLSPSFAFRLDGRYGFGPSAERAFVVGVTIDPVVWLVVQALREPAN